MKKVDLQSLIKEAVFEVMQEMARPNRKLVNKELSDLTSPNNRTQYFNGIPTQQVQEILDRYELGINVETRERVMDGIYTGADGKMEDPVSQNQHGEVNARFVMTWHRMDSGRYEIVAYVS